MASSRLVLRAKLSLICRGLREDETRWRFGLPARANTGDPSGLVGACRIMRSQAAIRRHRVKPGGDDIFACRRETTKNAGY